MFIRSIVICLRLISQCISRVMQCCSFRAIRASENVSESEVTSYGGLFCLTSSLKERWVDVRIDLKQRKATNPHVLEKLKPESA